MNRFIERLLKSEYFKNISVQVLGTATAQVLPLLIMPILSRIYNEETFASYATFIAFSGVLCVATGARYSYAIVLPKKENEAYYIFLVSIYYNVLYSILVALLIIVFNFFFENLHSIDYSFIFIPLYVLFYGTWLALINLSIRKKKFRVNSYSKILQSFSNVTSSLGLGFLKVFSGLILGKIIGAIVSVFFLSRKLTKTKSLKITYHDFKKISNKYRDFPLYGILPSFLDAASIQAPVFIIGAYFTVEQLGYYGFTVMVLAGPLSIISVSFRDVFYQKIAETYNQNKSEKLKSIFEKTALSLLGIGIPILLLLVFYGESLFAFIFGYKWADSGIYASILITSFIIKLVVSPLSSVFNVLNKLKVLSIWQTIYFFTTFSTLMTSIIIFKVDIFTFLKIYLYHELVLYMFYFILQYNAIKKFNLSCAE